MKKTVLMLTLALVLTLGLTVSVKAVVSEEFGGNKSNQNESKPEQEINQNENKQKSETTVTTMPELEREGESNNNDKDKPLAAELWTDTMEIAVDGGSLPPVKVSAENVSIQGNKLLFFSSSTGLVNEYQMKTALPAFVNQLVKAWRKEGATTTIENFEIRIEEDKPIYEVSVVETGKLLGFIPLKLERKAVISATTEEIEEVKQPWYSFLVRRLNLFKIQNEGKGENTTTTDQNPVE